MFAQGPIQSIRQHKKCVASIYYPENKTCVLSVLLHLERHSAKMVAEDRVWIYVTLYYQLGLFLIVSTNADLKIANNLPVVRANFVRALLVYFEN